MRKRKEEREREHEEKKRERERPSTTKLRKGAPGRGSTTWTFPLRSRSEEKGKKQPHTSEASAAVEPISVASLQRVFLGALHDCPGREGGDKSLKCSSYKAQRAQYPLITEYTLNYKGLHNMI